MNDRGECLSMIEDESCICRAAETVTRETNLSRKKETISGRKNCRVDEAPNDEFNSVRAYHERIKTLHSKERKVFFSAHFESSGFE